jgi:site-specific recombinase XerD
VARDPHDSPAPSPPTPSATSPAPADRDAPNSLTRRQRPHRPDDLGPRVFPRGRWLAIDLRPWGGERVTLRNPSARGWPQKGERTADPEVADRWKWMYVDHFRDAAKRRQLGRRPRAHAFGPQVEQFLSARELTVQALTVRADESTLRVHLLPYFGPDRDIETIEAPEIQTFFDRLIRAQYAPSTLQRMLHSLGAFFAWSGVSDTENPARKVTLPAIVNDDVRPFTDAELDVLRDKADWMDRQAREWTGQRTRPLPIRRALELGLGTGGRQAELLALDWPSFRERDKTVRFTVQVNRLGTGVTHLKGKLARTALVLPSWWAHHDRTARGRVLDLGRVDGALLNPAGKWLRRLYVRAGIVNIHQTWHALRHTYSRLFIEQGGRLEELQKSLGHKSIVTTEQEYGHLTEQTAAAMAARRIYGEDSPSPSRGPHLVKGGAA